VSLASEGPEMGDRYREYLKTQKKRSGYAPPTLVRPGATEWAALRELYYDQSPARRRGRTAAAKRKVRDA